MECSTWEEVAGQTGGWGRIATQTVAQPKTRQKNGTLQNRPKCKKKKKWQKMAEIGTKPQKNMDLFEGSHLTLNRGQFGTP